MSEHEPKICIPDTLPSYWEEIAERRQEISARAEIERINVRDLWPDGDVPDAPQYLADVHLGRLGEFGIELRYLPPRRIGPERVPSLRYPLAPHSVGRLVDMMDDEYDPFQLDSGWYLVPDFVREVDGRAIRQPDMSPQTAPFEDARKMIRVLSGNEPELTAPSAVELIYFANCDGFRVDDAGTVEYCRDRVFDRGQTRVIVTELTDAQGFIRVEEPPFPVSAKVRPILKLPEEGFSRPALEAGSS